MINMRNLNDTFTGRTFHPVPFQKYHLPGVTDTAMRAAKACKKGQVKPPPGPGPGLRPQLPGLKGEAQEELGLYGPPLSGLFRLGFPHY